MLFIHRANLISDVFKHYYSNYKAYEIDVQPTSDGIIVVYHDDCSHQTKESLTSTEIPTFEDFLKYTPTDIHLNVEIKKYPDSSHGIVDRVLELCERYPKHKFSFSSFDKDTYESLKGKVEDAWLLQDASLLQDAPLLEDASLLEDAPRICIHKSMLAKDACAHAHVTRMYDVVYVYDVKMSEVAPLQLTYPFVNGWIVDLD